MIIRKASWALALILSGTILATSAQASVGKSGYFRNLRGGMGGVLEADQKAQSCDQDSEQRSGNYRLAGLKHRFGIRR